MHTHTHTHTHSQVASNGVEAVKAIREGRQFDVVLMDMMMPVMNGVESTREIRAMGFTQLPILAMVRVCLLGWVVGGGGGMCKGKDGCVFDKRVLGGGERT